ncbi:hypothetical protein [Streptosporangium vulgare]|uniref:hypothetical protein n=1 Tax=Streptosporangium vulgare TaxID=46190 RepID=UPI0031CE0A4C
MNAHPLMIVGAPSAGERLQHVLLGLVGVQGPVEYSLERTADWSTTPSSVSRALTAVTTLYLVLRPERPVARLDPEQEKTVRELLARHGCPCTRSATSRCAATRASCSPRRARR